MRLNMIEVSENFRGMYREQMCVACGEEKETTEHAIQCTEYRRLTGHKLTVTDNAKCFADTSWLKKAADVYETIEETRKLL